MTLTSDTTVLAGYDKTPEEKKNKNFGFSLLKYLWIYFQPSQISLNIPPINTVFLHNNRFLLNSWSNSWCWIHFILHIDSKRICSVKANSEFHVSANKMFKMMQNTNVKLYLWTSLFFQIIFKYLPTQTIFFFNYLHVLLRWEKRYQSSWIIYERQNDNTIQGLTYSQYCIQQTGTLILKWVSKQNIWF